MIPPIPLPYVRVIVIALVLLAAFSSGWLANGWRLGTEIAELQAKYATAEADAAKAAIDDLIAATTTIKKAADEYTAIGMKTSSKIDKLRKEVQQYAKENPLPAGCKPDVIRVQKLTGSISAANEAITGQQPR